ncbi:MAG: Flp pilus assembly complex ATPase component TadA, partial [Bdellovibrionales bacterium]|nr:Flp pilus assembly complex ATPase component TadA [Oligoflexia bacterium]
GEAWSAEPLSHLAQSLMGPALWRDFSVKRSADLSRTIAGVRCRINCFQTVRGMSFAIRLLSSFKNTLRDCNLLPELRKLLDHKTGLILVCGPTGSGKSTTLAALIEELNVNTRSNILTIESPIEYFFQSRQSFIRQREIPLHSPSYEQAILDSLREDPDVLVIGEMREPEVMRLTLNAAETGHLVLATLHSATCAEAISRLCLSFPSDNQPAIRAQIADCLVAVVCQRLIYLPDRKIRVPVLEIMMGSTAIKASIRSGAISQLTSAIQTGGDDGMYSFDRYRRWVDQKKDWVSPAQAAPLIDTTSLETAQVPADPARRPNASSSGRSMLVSAPLSETSEGGASGRIEIEVDDADLERLARQIASEGDE